MCAPDLGDLEQGFSNARRGEPTRRLDPRPSGDGAKAPSGTGGGVRVTLTLPLAVPIISRPRPWARRRPRLADQHTTSMRATEDDRGRRYSRAT
jgi:hypothetical protein